VVISAVKLTVQPGSRFRVLRFAAVALVVGGLPMVGRASIRSETLEAIHRIENPKDSPRVGRHGELGAYQFRPATWRMHTKVPFQQALNRDASEDVAIRHYEWLRRGLVRNGFSETPYNIALAWNGGLSAAINGRASTAARDYAQRVSNLVQENRAAQLAVLTH